MEGGLLSILLSLWLVWHLSSVLVAWALAFEAEDKALEQSYATVAQKTVSMVPDLNIIAL